MYDGSDIRAHRAEIAENICKGFEDEFEKARNEGDIHPNGKWVWRIGPNGKGDWRVNKTGGAAKPAGSEPSHTKGDGDKQTLFEQIRNTPISKLTAMMAEGKLDNLPQNVKDYAKDKLNGTGVFSSSKERLSGNKPRGAEPHPEPKVGMEFTLNGKKTKIKSIAGGKVSFEDGSVHGLWNVKAAMAYQELERKNPYRPRKEDPNKDVWTKEDAETLSGLRKQEKKSGSDKAWIKELQEKKKRLAGKTHTDGSDQGKRLNAITNALTTWSPRNAELNGGYFYAKVNLPKNAVLKNYVNRMEKKIRAAGIDFTEFGLERTTNGVEISMKIKE